MERLKRYARKHLRLQLKFIRDYPSAFVSTSLFIALVYNIAVPVSRFVASHYPSAEKPDALGPVSGFYGPGVYASWLIAAMSSIISLNTFTGPPDSSSQPSKKSEEMPLEFDSKLFVACIYPIIAGIDAHVQFFVGNHGASLSAASSAAASGYMLGTTAIWVSERPESSRHTERHRITWLSVCCLCGSALLFCLMRDEKGTTQWRCCLLDLICGCIVCTFLWAYGNYRFPSVSGQGGNWFEGVFFVLFALGFPCICVSRGETSLIPRTSAKLGDLDQAAALGVTTCLLLYRRINLGTRN